MSVERAKLERGDNSPEELAAAWREEIAPDDTSAAQPTEARSEISDQLPRQQENVPQASARREPSDKDSPRHTAAANADVPHQVESPAIDGPTETRQEINRTENPPEPPLLGERRLRPEHRNEDASESAARQLHSVASPEPEFRDFHYHASGLENLLRKILDGREKPQTGKKEERRDTLRTHARAAEIEARLRQVEMRLRLQREI